MSRSDYKHVFKVTSLFGGVQVFTILINLLRSKIIALLLGTLGFGIAGLYNSPLAFIVSLGGLGITSSAVRNISQAYESGDPEQLSRILVVFRRWVWCTALAGVLITIVLSGFLSDFSFGNKTEQVSYIILSLSVLATILQSGYSAMLRGTRLLKDVARSTLYGAILGLVFTIPFYYYWGIKGIVPAILINALIALLFSYIYARRIPLTDVRVTWEETWNSGLSMVNLGIMMSLAGLIGNGVAYLVIAFIGRYSDLETVGLYNAGWGITNQYISLVFMAMAVDYFPRLSAIHADRLKLNQAVNQQAEIAVLILGPLMIIYLIVLPVFIPVILSESFIGILEFTQWIVLGVLFKATSWALGFIILAKGDSKLFLITEVLANGLILIGYLSGFMMGGLKGIGIAFVALYFIHALLMLIISYKKYGFRLDPAFSRILIIQFLLQLAAFITMSLLEYRSALQICVPVLILSSVHSIIILKRRIWN